MGHQVLILVCRIAVSFAVSMEGGFPIIGGKGRICEPPRCRIEIADFLVELSLLSRHGSRRLLRVLLVFHFGLCHGDLNLSAAFRMLLGSWSLGRLWIILNGRDILV